MLLITSNLCAFDAGLSEGLENLSERNISPGECMQIIDPVQVPGYGLRVGVIAILHESARADRNGIGDRNTQSGHDDRVLPVPVSLQEETTLSLGKSHGRGVLRVVVGHVVDPGAHGIAAHQHCVAGL
jgi:hypothetical protein